MPFHGRVQSARDWQNRSSSSGTQTRCQLAPASSSARPHSALGGFEPVGPPFELDEVDAGDRVDEGEVGVAGVALDGGAVVAAPVQGGPDRQDPLPERVGGVDDRALTVGLGGAGAGHPFGCGAEDPGGDVERWSVPAGDGGPAVGRAGLDGGVADHDHAESVWRSMNCWSSSWRMRIRRPTRVAAEVAAVDHLLDGFAVQAEVCGDLVDRQDGDDAVAHGGPRSWLST